MLPGNFRIPIGISIDSCIEYQLDQTVGCLESVQGTLADYGQRYLQEQMVAGTIDDHVVFFNDSQNRICMTGQYICTEMIGRVQQEQNGE